MKTTIHISDDGNIKVTRTVSVSEVANQVALEAEKFNKKNRVINIDNHQKPDTDGKEKDMLILRRGG